MKYYILAGIFLVQGCAQMIPARAWDQGEGIYKLEASGNVFASDKSLHEKVEKKANKVCGSGFKYIEDSDPNWHKQTTYSNGMRIDASYKVLTKTIKCN